MKVLANDGISAEGAKILTDAGFEVDQNKISQEDLTTKLNGYDAIIVRSATKVTKEVIDSSDLKVIARAGVGLDNIDTKYAKEKNIPVLNTPEASSISVAELSIAHMFALSRFLHVSTNRMKNGEWPKKEFKGIELTGRTLGLIGYGNIGIEVAKRAIGLGMKVVVYNHTPIETELKIQVCFRIEDLLEQADFISLHVPFIKSLGPVITKAEIDKMKDGVILINCARGGVVDESALLDGLNNGKIRAAGIDVFENEPPTENQKALFEHSNVSLTPHIGGSTEEAQDRIGIEIAEKLVTELNKIR